MSSALGEKHIGIDSPRHILPGGSLNKNDSVHSWRRRCYRGDSCSNPEFGVGLSRVCSIFLLGKRKGFAPHMETKTNDDTLRQRTMLGTHHAHLYTVLHCLRGPEQLRCSVFPGVGNNHPAKKKRETGEGEGVDAGYSFNKNLRFKNHRANAEYYSYCPFALVLNDMPARGHETRPSRSN